MLLLDLEKSLANANGTGGTIDYMESPVSDGTIEENFEEELVNAPQVVEGLISLNDNDTGNLSDDLDEYDVRRTKNKYYFYYKAKISFLTHLWVL